MSPENIPGFSIINSFYFIKIVHFWNIIFFLTLSCCVGFKYKFGSLLNFEMYFNKQLGLKLT